MVRKRSVPLAGLSVVMALGVMATATPVAAEQASAASGSVAPDPRSTSAPATGPGAAQPYVSTVPPLARDAVLPAGWRSSTDLAWTTAGDATGFHLLVAEARTGYTWRTAATLWRPGFETDRWVGNVCLTGSGRRAVVVYAPRQFTNRERLFQRGAFAAVVDIDSGRVRGLPVTVSLAYHNPGCGTGETAVLTQSGLTDFGRTRLLVYDTARAALVRRLELDGQVTSAVPTGETVVAAGPTGLEEIAASGHRRTLARTHGAAFAVHPDSGGGVAFLEAHGDHTTVVRRFHAGQATEVARGPLTGVALAAGTGGRIFLTGRPDRVGALPEGMRHLDVPVSAWPSTTGAAVLTTPGGRDAAAATTVLGANPHAARPVDLRMTVTATGRELNFRVTPDATAGAAGTAEASDTLVATSSIPSCAVGRNNPNTQVYQPHWDQVEWAADLAIQGALTVQRPSNWKYSGLAAWKPQEMFPRLGLASGTGGNHRVPAQILLGVLAQESNMWQASPHALEGVTGNPLVGNFYGLTNEDDADSWVINFDEADCGYGVAQVTDGMRLSDTSRTTPQKVAIALDYASNIAAGLRILEDKFNHTWLEGIKINSGNPWWIENWFAALWAYNTGMQPRDAEYGNTTGCRPSPSCTDGRGNWGLGWFNNPINPEYPANRTPFLNGSSGEGSPGDAARPQEWPYPEKVMGWAAFPITKTNPFNNTWDAGYNQAWWTDAYFRTQVKPPRTLFCDSSNRCDPALSNICYDPETHCWWNRTAVWKPNCLGRTPWQDPMSADMVSCGQESVRFDPGSAEPYGGTFNDWYKPNCALTGLPSGAMVIDDVATNTNLVRGCEPRPFTNRGSFSLNFAVDETGQGRSQIDFHQIGGGFNGHFWFGHTYPDSKPTFAVTGTWTLDTALTNTWARVLVHVPDHGSETQQARYVIDRGSGSTRHRVVNAKALWKQQRHRWVSLGVFLFNGTPKVSLSNVTRDGTGAHSVAWDAVAFQPLPAKPRNFVVGLGDSYSSGEAAVSDLQSGSDYDRESDMDGRDDENRNNCHRSIWAWVRKATLKDQPEWLIGSREVNLDNDLDFHFPACSGAQTENLLPFGTQNSFGEASKGQHGELPQLETGFLDENTTLVTLSIGGNDSGFGDVITQCFAELEADCPVTTLSGDTEEMWQAVPRRIDEKVVPSIKTVIQQIRGRAPNAKIVLMGYPNLLSNEGSCLNLLQVWIPYLNQYINIGITPAEAEWLNSVGDHLAGAMGQATADLRAQGIPVWFADPRSYFEGAGICSDAGAIHALVGVYTPGENPDIALPENPFFRIGGSQQSFHPSTLGTTRYANTLMDTLHRPEIDQ